MSLIGGMAGKIFSAPKFKKRRFDPEKMSVEDIMLPAPLKRLEDDQLRPMVKAEIDTFKSLGYKDQPLENLKREEYHSWQIGVILKFLKEDHVYPLHNIDEILPSMVFHITKKQLHIKVFDVVARYHETVESDFLKEDLEKDMRWSPIDMAYLLRYATLENRSIIKS